MTDDKRVALIEALSKLGLGTCLAALMAWLIWLNYQRDAVIAERVNVLLERQTVAFEAMVNNQDVEREILMQLLKEALEKK